MVDLIDFKIEEFDCPCCHANKMDVIFLKKLQDFRTMMGVPFKIDSGYRCAKHNASLKDSSPHSLHLQGRAADISIVDMSKIERHVFMTEAFSRFGGIGMGRTFVHLDDRVTRASWTYPVR